MLYVFIWLHLTFTTVISEKLIRRLVTALLAIPHSSAEKSGRRPDLQSLVYFTNIKWSQMIVKGRERSQKVSNGRKRSQTVENG